MKAQAFSVKAFRLYLAERFPLGMNGTAIFLLYSCNLLASALMQGIPPPNPLIYLLGFLWAAGVFYHLRVLDDLKDRDNDTKAYPDRILSRGLVTYRQLFFTGVAAVVVETVIAATLGSKILFLHFATLAYSLLMYKEFFVHAWLKRHLFWYGLTHMLILALIDFTILQMPNGHGAITGAPGIFLFAYLSFFMTFSMEVARKIRLPSAEREEIDTYSKVIGVGGAMSLVHALQAAVLLIAFLLRSYLHIPAWFYAGSIAAWLIVVAWYAVWRPRLTEKRSLKLDKVAALFFMEFYLSLVGFLAWHTWKG